MQSKYLLKLKTKFNLEANYLDYIINSFEDNNNQSDLCKYLKLKKIISKNIKTKYPIQYLIDHTYFYNDLFLVNKEVLIPRLDSEPMIENIINLGFANKKILEVGTGSGALIISVAKRLTSNNYEAVDISKTALKIALKNQKYHNTQINFYQSDLFTNCHNHYDLIIANLPYLLTNERTKELDYEPDLALYGGKTGLDIIYKFLDNLLNYLNINGLCYLEHGITQQEEINKYLIKFKEQLEITNYNDFSNRPRYMVIRRIK